MSVQARFHLARSGFVLDVDLELPGRGVSGVLGPSGSGKTTLLRAMAGLEQVPGGRLQVNGQAWQDGERFLPVHRRPLGYVFQEPSLFAHLDVRGNLEYGWRRVPTPERRIALDSAIQWLGVGALLGRHPETLSGGEKQRVAIARALAVSPRLLLLDEPLASLDLQRKADILPYLKTLHRELDIPVVYVSHVPEELADLADYLVLMDAGQVRAAGPMTEMMTRPELPLARLPGAFAVLETRVGAHLEEWQLSTLEFQGGSLTVPKVALPAGTPVRVRIAARDVSLALQPPAASSILNCLPARVSDITADGPAQVLVRLDLGDGKPGDGQSGAAQLLSRVTRKSAAELQLQAGLALYAQVKSVALLS